MVKGESLPLMAGPIIPPYHFCGAGRPATPRKTRSGAEDAHWSVGYYGIIPAVACIVVFPLYCLAFLMPSPLWGLGFNGVGVMILSLWYAPVFTTAQSVVEPRGRATASAVLFLTYSIIGLGLGPLGLGLLSDWISSGFDIGPVEGLRWSLVLSNIGLLIAVPLYWLASRSMERDVDS